MRVCLTQFGTNVVGFPQSCEMWRGAASWDAPGMGTSAFLDSTTRPLHLCRPPGAEAPPLRPGRWGGDTREGGLASLVSRPEPESPGGAHRASELPVRRRWEAGGNPPCLPCHHQALSPQSRVYPQFKGVPHPALDFPHMQSLWHWLGVASDPGRFAGIWGPINFPLPPCSPPL